MTTDQLREKLSNQVRLFPSSHISSEREAELRAAAALLATMRAVSQFGRNVVRRAGGPAGRILCFAEPTYTLDRGSSESPVNLRPDGLVWAARGKRSWTALVEIKVGRAALDPEQLDMYLRLARQERIDALITVSNQPALPDRRPPVSIDGRRLRSTPVVHFSWERLLSEAQLLARRKEIDDPDQKWILDEWIRYVSDPKSRIIESPDLGPHWRTVLRAAQTGNLAHCSAELRDVAASWIGYLEKLVLRLRAKLGAEVSLPLRRKEKQDPELLVQETVRRAQTAGELSGALRVPDAAGLVRIDVYLPSRSVKLGLEVDAPSEGRQMTRINWLARQLRSLDVPNRLVVTAFWQARGLATSAPASAVRADPRTLLLLNDGRTVPKKIPPRRYLLEWTIPLPRARGRSSAPVLEDLTKRVEEFYHRVVENLVPYTPRAPRLEVSREQPSSTQPSEERQPQSTASDDAATPSDPLTRESTRDHGADT